MDKGGLFEQSDLVPFFISNIKNQTTVIKTRPDGMSKKTTLVHENNGFLKFKFKFLF